MPCSPRVNRYSITDACGNFGARPQPPLTLSKPLPSVATASSRAACAKGSCDGVSSAPPARRGATRSPCARISSRWVSHASATAASTWRQLGIPWRGDGGKYVPP
jgi:hypothetical protein